MAPLTVTLPRTIHFIRACTPPQDLSGRLKSSAPWERQLAPVVLAPDVGIQSLRGCSVVGAGSAYADE